MSLYAPIKYLHGFRYTIERMEPSLYLSYAYYEKWLHARIQGCLENGILTENEFSEKEAHYREFPDAVPPVSDDPAKVQKVVSALFESYQKDPVQGTPALLELRQSVRVKSRHPAGHTRLPRYCRGKIGIIEKN